MSATYTSRILELLRQQDYPGADRFTERDIEILTKHPTVAALMTKFAELHPSQFLTKEQVDVLRLAGELDHPSFLPLDPVEIRKQLANVRKNEREHKRSKMLERHRSEQIAQIKKVTTLLEEDEILRNNARRKRERMNEDLEAQIKKAESSLKTAQQDLQTASITFNSEVQRTFKDMRHVVERIKQPGGLRSMLDDDSYIKFANDTVDIFEFAYNSITQPKQDPHKYVVQVGNKQVAIIESLERLSKDLDVYRDSILNSLRPVCQNFPMFATLTDTLTSYARDLQDTINAFNNRLFDNATMINKKRMEKMLLILKKFEVVVFAQRSILLEENRLLEETLEMIRNVHEWKQKLISTTKDVSNISMSRTTIQQNTTMSNDVTFYPSPCLSSTMLENFSLAPSCLNSTTCAKSTMVSVGNRKQNSYPTAYFDEILESISNDCSLFQKITEHLEEDRSILCGTSGIQFMSESNRAQLQLLRHRTASKKAALKKLIRTQEILLKDARDHTKAHYKRMLIPLYVLDREKYQSTLQSIGLEINIFNN